MIRGGAQGGSRRRHRSREQCDATPVVVDVLSRYRAAPPLAGGRAGELLEADISTLVGSHRPDAYLPPGARFPRFMLLAFSKP
jgi:hypothetical protein